MTKRAERILSFIVFMILAVIALIIILVSGKRTAYADGFRDLNPNIPKKDCGSQAVCYNLTTSTYDDRFVPDTFRAENSDDAGYIIKYMLKNEGVTMTYAAGGASRVLNGTVENMEIYVYSIASGKVIAEAEIKSKAPASIKEYAKSFQGRMDDEAVRDWVSGVLTTATAKQSAA